MRSTISVTVYLILALYGSATLQSQSFLKNIQNFLCKWKLVNNRSIPSTYAERMITLCSHKHSFTLYPSLSPYWQTEWQTERRIHLLHVGWRNIFPVVVLCQFLDMTEINLGDTYLPYQLCCCVFFLLRQEIVFSCTGWFFGCGGKKF